MGQSKLELAVGTGKWDAGLKKAQQSLNNFTQAQGGLQQALAKDNGDMQKFVQMMAKMDSTANTAKGQMNDYKRSIEQLSAAYNQMSSAQQASIGQDYLKTIDALKQKFQDAKQQCDELSRSLNGINLPDMSGGSGGGLFKGLGDKMSGALQVFAGNMMTKAAGAALEFAGDIGECVKQGIELARQGEGIRIAFERLDQPGILDNLREATNGTVTDLELMKAAVKFNDFKLPLDQLGTMLAFAQKKAKDTGQSVDYMVDSIVTGLGRKSLMILDNLGLSATEVKEKMKETGDMTKAVGAIIREQMSKAGGYVETAADRATQADVKLKNAMEDLGRTFQPLSDAGTSLWSDLKIGALDLLNNAVRPLIDALTEAGRIRSQYAEQGGDTRVNRQLDRLRGISTLQYRRNTYNAQLSNYDSKIGSYQQYLADYKKWQSDKTAVGAYDRMQAFQKQTGLSMYSDVKEQLEVFKKMRSEYVMGAKSIIADNPAPSPTSTTTTTTTKGGSGKTGPTYASDSIAAQQKLVQDLTKQWNEAGADVRDQYLQPLVEAEAKLKEMQNTMALQKAQAEGKLNGVNLWQGDIDDITGGKRAQFAGTLPDLSKSLQLDNLPLAPLQQLNAELARLKELLELAPNSEAYQAGLQAIADKEKEIANFKGIDLSKDADKSAKSFQTAAAAIGQVGSAMSRIEDPTMKIMGIVAQAIATVAQGFATATTAESGKGVYAWIAAIAGGMATMYSTIESIHSATGYAQGGLIKGNSYSGDNIGGVVDGSQFVGLNAGEVVLNASQQSMLASNLQGGSGGKMEIVGVLSGENVVLMADRWGRRTGRGELLFGKNL